MACIHCEDSYTEFGSKKPRLETDALGTIQIPGDKYYGCTTRRCMTNFPIGGQNERIPFPFIVAMGYLKKAIAKVNTEFGLDINKADAIIQACDDVISGKLYCEGNFPLVIWQTGCLKNIHQNIIEVIANRAIQIMGGKLGSNDPVHQEFDVTMLHTCNDVVQSAIHVAVSLEIRDILLPGLTTLRDSLYNKSKEFESIIKIGRSHLRDSVPMSLGQEFSGYTMQMTDAIERVNATLPRLHYLAIGGTHIGTGLYSRKGFPERVTAELTRLIGIPFYPSLNKFEAIANTDVMAEISGVLNVIACSLMKIANDINLLSSGPRCGLSELILPEYETPCSKLHKTNPVQVEAVAMVAAQVMGNHVAVTVGCSYGQLELNVFKPLIISNILRSIKLIGDVCQSFTKLCIVDIQPNIEILEQKLKGSLAMAPALRSHLDNGQIIILMDTTLREGGTLKENAIKLELLTADEYDEWVKPEKMLEPEN